eukprot:scaffold16278_cov17-Tisochrysis_lutea.AAC.1
MLLHDVAAALMHIAPFHPCLCRSFSLRSSTQMSAPFSQHRGGQQQKDDASHRRASVAGDAASRVDISRCAQIFPAGWLCWRGEAGLCGKRGLVMRNAWKCMWCACGGKLTYTGGHALACTSPRSSMPIIFTP